MDRMDTGASQALVVPIVPFHEVAIYFGPPCKTSEFAGSCGAL